MTTRGSAGRTARASWAPNTTSVIGEEPAAKANGAAAPAAPRPTAMRRRTAPPHRPRAALDQDQLRAATLDSLRALMLIRAYRVRGHLQANLDPLGLEKREPHPELDPRTYGFTDADFDRPIFIDNVLGIETATLRQILAVLREDLLRHDRRRVHAHPGPRPEGLDPGAHRRRPQPHRLHRQRQEARSSSA